MSYCQILGKIGQAPDTEIHWFRIRISKDGSFDRKQCQELCKEGGPGYDGEECHFWLWEDEGQGGSKCYIYDAKDVPSNIKLVQNSQATFGSKNCS